VSRCYGFAKPEPAMTGAGVQVSDWTCVQIASEKPQEPNADCVSEKKRPSAVCLGRARVDKPMGYRFSLLTLCFQEYVYLLNPKTA